MAGSKAEQKAKQKIIEDKTFGLKNKNKSAKVSKYVAQLEQNLNNQGKKSSATADTSKFDRAKRKEEEDKRKAELAALLKPALSQPKLPFGADPKSVLCVFFKAGQCAKGDKCKYSHDLAVERKSAKIDIYTDPRDTVALAADANGMEGLSQKQLESTAGKKGSGSVMRPSSKIICKFFIEAVEQNKYGWFWECPNGGDKCQHRHALPEGYVLKKDSKANKAAMGDGEDEDEESIDLEEFLEVERHKLHATATAPLTPVTEESFAAWKAARRAKSEELENARLKLKEGDFRKGGAHAVASGKELFAWQPEIFRDAEGEDGDEAMDLDYTHREEVQEDVVTKEELFLVDDVGGLTITDDES